MARYVLLVNEQDHRIERVKVGFSWVLLFWTWLLGIPLFLRRVYTWAFAVLAIDILLPLVERRVLGETGWVVKHFQDGFKYSHQFSYVSEWSGLIILALSVYLGFRGNEVTGRYYLKRGWDFADPESSEAKYARSRWHMPI